MPVIDIVLVPLPATPGRYKAMLGGQELCRSRQPLLDAARFLLSGPLALSPETRIETRHQGSDIVAQRSTVGEAAKWTIVERDRGGLRRELWKPREETTWIADPPFAAAPDFEQNAEKGGVVASDPENAPFEAPRAKRGRA